MRKATREDVYDAIDSEREYQDQIWRMANPAMKAGATWSETTVPNELTIGEFVLLIEEYAAKARAEWTVEPKPEIRTLDVMRKIAGIAVNCMEQHGAIPRGADLDDYRA